MSKVIVIGAGPAGITASIGAAKAGHDVLLIEKNSSIGCKLAITGGGRCNITNTADIASFLNHVISNRKFLYAAFNTFFNNEIISLLEDEGTKTKIESQGRVFPISDTSKDVIAALASALIRYNVTIRTDTCADSLIVRGFDKIQVSDSDAKAESRKSKCIGLITKSGEKIGADIVIVATGGISYPLTGSTGDGYKFAENIGINLISPIPVLTPLILKETEVVHLQGLSLKDAGVTVKQGGKKLFSRTGEVIFTHYGISGPLILNASGYCGRYLKKSPLALHIDLLPLEYNIDKKLLQLFEPEKNRYIGNVIKKLFPESLSLFLLQKSGISSDKPVNKISKSERLILGENIKNLDFTIIGSKQKEAVITQGGVDIKDINPKTMASKKISGLKFAGEVLDLDAETGGFNLQIAWSTGYVAGITC